MRRTLRALRRNPALPILTLGTAASIAAIWFSGPPLWAGMLASVAVAVFALAVALFFARIGRALGAVERERRLEHKSNLKELSRVLYHARRGAEAAISTRDSSAVTAEAVAKKVAKSTSALLASVPLAPAVPTDQPHGHQRATEVILPTRIELAAAARRARRGSDWETVREFDLAPQAPFQLGPGDPRVLGLLSSRLRSRLSAAAHVITSAETLEDMRSVDMVLVSEDYVREAGDVADEPRTVAEEVARRLQAAAAQVSPGTRLVAWLESTDLRKPELYYLSSMCDVVVVPNDDMSREIPNGIVCVGVAESPADARDDTGSHRAGVWTPAPLLDALRGWGLPDYQPRYGCVTVVTTVRDVEQATAATDRFRRASRRIFSRLLLILSEDVPASHSMSYMRRFGDAVTWVTHASLLATPEGRSGLVETGYALVVPPGHAYEATQVTAALKVAESSLVPLAIGLAGSTPTLVSRGDSSLLVAGSNAIAVVRSRDGLIPAMPLGAS